MTLLTYSYLLFSEQAFSSFSVWTEWSQSASRSFVSDSLQTHPLYSPWNSLDQNTGVCSISLLQGIFPTQGLKPTLPHCRQILNQFNHRGRPRILEWVAYPFSSRLPDPGIEPGSPVLQVDSLPTELSGKPHGQNENIPNLQVLVPLCLTIPSSIHLFPFTFYYKH